MGSVTLKIIQFRGFALAALECKPDESLCFFTNCPFELPIKMANPWKVFWTLSGFESGQDYYPHCGFRGFPYSFEDMPG
jgi:hypothetical protein